MPVRIWKILDIIALVKKYSDFLPLLDTPDWENAEAVRTWVVKLLSVAEKITDGTENKIDDVIVDLGQSLTRDPQAWSTFYSLIWDVITGETSGVEGDDRVTVLAQEVKLDPAIIILIINAVIELIKWFKNR